MTTETNKALLRACFQAVNEANFAALEDHPGFWETRTVVPPMHVLFADWRTTHVQQIAESNKVFSYGVTEFTHVGPFAGIAPIGRRVALGGLFLDQVADKRVIEHNGTTCWPDVLRQIGHYAFDAWPAHTPRLLAQSATSEPRTPAMLAANKRTVAQLLEAVSRGDTDAMLHHDGIGEVQDEFAAIRTAFPNLIYELVMQVAEGDLVGTRATLRGTHRGELYGLPPTGKAIAWDFFSFARVVNGAVVEHNGSADWTAALFHLGLMGM